MDKKMIRHGWMVTLDFALALLIGLSFANTTLAQGSIDLDKIKLPPGFKISLFAKVPNARSMVVVPEHNGVFVGNRRGGSVFLAVDNNRDGLADEVAQITSGLVMPNGVAWKNGYLYIAEQHRIFRVQVPDLKSFGRHPAEVIFKDLPNKSWHGWRYIAFDEAQRLHITVGAPCNICTTRGLEGTIIRLDKNNRAEIIARGIRNSVGMDFNPRTGQIYFTDNGADFMGDDTPPDELNHISGPGQHFGFPYFGGGTDRTAEFRDQTPDKPTQPPVVKFGAHVAALGIHFYRGTQFPKAYRKDAFVAQHGSWNRKVPQGYRIMRIRMDEKGKVLGKEVFAEGWLQGRSAWGRPVDIKELPDGSLLVSDDSAGVIYRISYKN
jgi:glucose/arabinose dehydrogenase